MAALDYNYVASLVDRTRQGDSTAFAELFAATYEGQFDFANFFLEDEKEACWAIEDAYTAALKGLDSLRDSKLFVSWLCQLNFRACHKLAGADAFRTNVVINGKAYPYDQIMALPFSESQALFLRYGKRLSLKKIASMLEISTSTALGFIRSGKKHLASISRRLSA